MVEQASPGSTGEQQTTNESRGTSRDIFAVIQTKRVEKTQDHFACPMQQHLRPIVMRRNIQCDYQHLSFLQKLCFGSSSLPFSFCVWAA